MAAFLEQRLRVGLLEVATAYFSGGDVRGDAEHRDARAVAIKQAIDEVQIAWTAAPRAYGERSRQMRFRTSRKCGDLLVPDVDPLDLPLVAEGVGQAVEAVTDDPIYALDAGCTQRFGNFMGNGLGHVEARIVQCGE